MYNTYNYAEERRQAERQQVSMAGTLRVSGGRRVIVEFRDISVLGFSCEYASTLAIGEHVWAKFANLDALEATVVRRDGYYYGLMFNAPLHAAIFDHVVARYGRVLA